MKITCEEFVNIMELYKASVQKSNEMSGIFSDEYMDKNIDGSIFPIYDYLMINMGLMEEVGDDTNFDNQLWDFDNGSIPVEWKEDDKGNVIITKYTKDLSEAYDALVPDNCKC